MKKYCHKSIPYICAFFIPFILMLIVYILLGVYPFGDSTLLSGDMSVQYIAFLSNFADILRGDASPFYSFGKVLGGEMIGFGAYYIYSPYNLITLLFSRENLPSAVTLITLMKIGSCGLTMYCYLRSKRMGKSQTPHAAAVFFASCYALMAYNAAYQLNIMWLDGVILLPLLIYGLEQLYSFHKWYFYTIFLSMALIFNYYTGYMLCLFAVLYFLSLLFFESGRPWIKSCLLFVWASLLAGGLSAVVLLPTALSLQGGKAEFNISSLFNFQLNFQPFTFLYGLFPVLAQENLPNIYCGILTLLGAVLFFASHNFRLRCKLGKFFLLLSLFLSMLFYGPDRLWHATAVPAGSPYRYSFLFSFLMIQLAYLWFTSCSYDISWLHRRWPCLLICLFSGIELTVNAFCALNVGHEAYTGHRTTINKFESLIKQIPEISNTFFRMEVLPKHCLNEPMHLNYNGLTSYSSCEQTDTKEFAGKMGINDKGWWINFTGETPIAIDSFLNLKYIITNKETPAGYQKTAESGNYILYENPYVLPVGMMARETIYQTYMYDEQSIIDVFAIQNQIWKSIGSSDSNIFEAVPAEETVRDDHCIEYVFSPLRDGIIFTNVHNEMLDNLQVWVNGELMEQQQPEKQIYPLGPFHSTDTVRVRAESSQNINWYDLFFYHENMAVLENEIPDIQKNGYQVKEYNGNYFKGSVINDSSEYQYLLLTIPYDKGWEVFVDGTQMEIIPALGHLISLPVAPGAHEVILHFMPPGLKKGLLVSVGCAFVLIASILFDWRKHSPDTIQKLQSFF